MWVISLQQAWNGGQDDKGLSWDVFSLISVLSGEGNIIASEADMHAQADTDDGRRAGMSGSNSCQVCGVLEE